MRTVKNYHFLWKENYIDFLWTKSVTVPAYFLVEGVVVYENGALNAYASDKEKRAAYEYGMCLFKKKDTADIFTALKLLKKEVIKNKKLFTSDSLQKLTDKMIYKRYELLFSFMKRFVAIYRFTEPYYLAYFEQQLEDNLKSAFSNKKKRDMVTIQLLSTNNSKLIKNLPEENKEQVMHVASLLNSLAKGRFSAKSIDRKISDMAEELLIETARRHHLAITQVSHLDPKELKALLKKGILPNLRVLNQRKTAFALEIVTKKDKIMVREFLNKRVEQIITRLKLADQLISKTQCKGGTAYPGKVKGKARVLPTICLTKEYKDFIANFKKGEILVAPMTAPDLVPIFSKAKAIVTDEGGLTSHAALVAREMKRPCVIGTAIATKIIKDGAFIEVDATNGVVTIL